MSEKNMEDHRILTSICGKNTIRLRPSLNHYNCDMFLNKFELAIIE